MAHISSLPITGPSLGFPPTSRTSSSLSKPTQSKYHLPRIRLAFVALALIASLGSTVVAQEDPYPPHITQPPSLDLRTPALVLDSQPPPVAAPEAWPMVATGNDLSLNERASGDGAGGTAQPSDDDGDDSKSSREEKSSKTKDEDESKTMAKATVSLTTLTVPISKPTPTVAPNTPLPSPFDDTMSSEFKGPGGDSSCPIFMQNLLSDPTFKNCYPLSMMLQTSTSFFQAEKSLVSIVRVLDATCAANVTTCTEFFNSAANNLTADANCKQEIDDNQSLVTQAFQGLRAYGMLYSASCLQDPDTGSYCFANAVTNLTTPSNSYLYFMPYGLALPGSSVPTCNWCTQETMNIYHAASADRKQSIAETYEPAALQVNTICGPDFVNGTLPKAQTGAASIVASSLGTVLAAFAGVIALSSVL